MDRIDNALQHISIPANWYVRSYEWFEVIGYNPAFGITVMMSHSVFSDALEDARRLGNEFGDSWRIIRHNEQSVKIAESIRDCESED